MEIIKWMEQTEKKVKDLKIETDKLAKELKAK